MAAAPSPTSQTRRVFHIRGSGSSGTNWACALMNLHPAVCCSGEWCFRPIREGIDRWEGQAWTFATSARMRAIVEGHLAQMVCDCLNAHADQERPGAVWVGDRSPEPVRELVPGAPVILTIRDGRDVLVSMTLRYLREGLEKPSRMVAQHPGMGSVSERFRQDPRAFCERAEGLLPDESWVRRCAERWARHMRADLAAMEALGENGCIVRYEDMHEDVQRERARMYALLGLDPQDAEPVGRDSRTSAGFDGEDPLSFYRAGRVGDWQRWMDARALSWFEDEAGQVLEELGYATPATARN